MYPTHVTIFLLPDQQNVNKSVSFFNGLKLTMSFRPYFYLVMMYMFGWVAINVSKCYYVAMVITISCCYSFFKQISVSMSFTR